MINVLTKFLCNDGINLFEVHDVADCRQPCIKMHICIEPRSFLAEANVSLWRQLKPELDKHPRGAHVQRELRAWTPLLLPTALPLLSARLCHIGSVVKQWLIVV